MAMVCGKKAGLVIVIVGLALGGCAGPKSASKAGGDAGAQQPSDSSVTTSRPDLASQAEGAALDSGDATSTLKLEGMPEKQTVYFAYDSSDISAEGREIIRTHADFLLKNNKLRVRLEGHTDSRGTREYNIALGERRAKSVQQVLLVLGVDRGRLEPVSYGEERPVDSEENEAAWAKNRRVEFVYH